LTVGLWVYNVFGDFVELLAIVVTFNDKLIQMSIEVDIPLQARRKLFQELSICVQIIRKIDDLSYMLPFDLMRLLFINDCSMIEISSVINQDFNHSFSIFTNKDSLEFLKEGVHIFKFDRDLRRALNF